MPSIYKLRLIMGSWYISFHESMEHPAKMTNGPFTWAELNELIPDVEAAGYHKEQ